MPIIAAMQVSYLCQMHQITDVSAQERNSRPILRPSPSWDLYSALKPALRCCSPVWRAIKGCDRWYHHWCGTGCIIDCRCYLLLEEGLDKRLVGKGLQRTKQALRVFVNSCALLSIHSCFRCQYFHAFVVNRSMIWLL